MLLFVSKCLEYNNNVYDLLQFLRNKIDKWS